MIANLTGDIGQYLEDGENGFVVHTLAVRPIAELILHVSGLSATARRELRKAAASTSQRFLATNFETDVGDLLA